MESKALVTVAVHVVEDPTASVEEEQLTDVDVALSTVKSMHTLEPPMTPVPNTLDLALYEPTGIRLDTLYIPAGSVVAGRIMTSEPTHELEFLQTLTSTE